MFCDEIMAREIMARGSVVLFFIGFLDKHIDGFSLDMVTGLSLLLDREI